MINDDTLIKILRSRGFKYDWPEAVNHVKFRWKEVKLGFPGIGDDHVSLVEYKTIQIDDLFIIDPYFNYSDDFDKSMLVPLLLKKEESEFLIEGLGAGIHLNDPDRKIRWKDHIRFSIPENYMVWKIDVRPTENGGPGYYYFFKSPRDFRL